MRVVEHSINYKVRKSRLHCGSVVKYYHYFIELIHFDYKLCVSIKISKFAVWKFYFFSSFVFYFLEFFRLVLIYPCDFNYWFVAALYTNESMDWRCWPVGSLVEEPLPDKHFSLIFNCLVFTWRKFILNIMKRILIFNLRKLNIIFLFIIFIFEIVLFSMRAIFIHFR